MEFYNENRDLLNQAAQRFGVPAPIIASIIGVETLYGRNMGNFRVLDALTTLAFDYPDPDKPERAAMFRGQLGDFLTLVMQGKLDLETRGSYAGAIGMPQFMPGSIMRYAVDGDDSGHIDRTNSTKDAILSVGSFLAQHGWQRGVPVFAPVTLPADPSAPGRRRPVPKQSWNTISAAGGACSPAPPPLAGAPIPGHRRSGRRSARHGPIPRRYAQLLRADALQPQLLYATAVADLPPKSKPRRPLNAAGKPPQPEEPAPVEGCFNPGRTEPALPVRRGALEGRSAQRFRGGPHSPVRSGALEGKLAALRGELIEHTRGQVAVAPVADDEDDGRIVHLSATRSAATRAPAEEIPAKMPSAASRRAIVSASACTMDS